MVQSAEDRRGDQLGGAADRSTGLRLRNRRIAVEALIAALKDEDGNVRFIAAWALGELQDARAMGPLEGLLGDKDADVRKTATEALEQLRWQSQGSRP